MKQARNHGNLADIDIVVSDIIGDPVPKVYTLRDELLPVLLDFIDRHPRISMFLLYRHQGEPWSARITVGAVGYHGRFSNRRVAICLALIEAREALKV